jgi:hypothetical protein
MATASTPRDRTRDIAVLACAISAGVHAGLVPSHLHESGRLAGAFAVAAALTAVAAAPTITVTSGYSALAGLAGHNHREATPRRGRLNGKGGLDGRQPFLGRGCGAAADGAGRGTHQPAGARRGQGR